MKKLIIAALLIAPSAFAQPKAPAPPAVPAVPEIKPAAGAPAELPAMCKEYSDKMLKCLDSKQFPEAAKAQTKQAFETMKTSWNFAGIPEQARKAAMDAANTGCQTALDGMKQAGAAMCPGVF
jgi:hypothetical protein